MSFSSLYSRTAFLAEKASVGGLHADSVHPL